MNRQLPMSKQWRRRFLLVSTLALSVLAAVSAAASFIPTGSLGIARYHHTATLLTNGQVLVAGGSGSGNNNFLASAEIYDPSTGSWTPTSPMTSVRFYATAALLASGKVLIAGGYNTTGGYLSSAELYDRSTGTWSPTSGMTNARYACTATLLPSGKVLVAGGQNPIYLSSAQLYDPVAGIWTATSQMAASRVGHTATLLPNGKVLVIGGRSGTDLASTLSSAEIYDPATGTWIATAPMSKARSSHTATLLPDGKVLVAGGYLNFSSPTYTSNGEVYDPTTGTWTPTAALNIPRALHAATLLPNGIVLIAGGDSTNETQLASAELYDPGAGRWVTAGTMANVRRHHTITLLPGGRTLLVGGQIGNGPTSSALSTAELYVPEPLVHLTKAVKPSFSGLLIGTNYQLQLSTNLNNWYNQGPPFTATNTSLSLATYYDVDFWNQLFFRLQVFP